MLPLHFTAFWVPSYRSYEIKIKKCITVYLPYPQSIFRYLLQGIPINMEYFFKSY